MDKNKNNNFESAFSTILRSWEVPKSTFVLLLLLYIIGNGATITISRMQGTMVAIAGNRIPMSSFAGVASSISNICIILLTIFFRRTGFFTSLVLLTLQMPLLISGIITGKNPTSVPGLFTNLVTILAIFVIYSNTRRLEKIQQRMREQALTDRLTGLPNRFACTEFIEDLIKREEKFVLVSIDLNNFKGINDTIGHEAGDKMLIEVANRWKNAADAGTTGTLDFVCRLGGDEFALIIQGYDSEKEVVGTIARYESILENKITIDGYDYMINASFGYAEHPTDATTGGMLMSYADATMYEVKRINSSNHVLRFSPDLLKMEHALEIERQLRNALEKDAIFFHLQPQYDFSKKLCGFEALARMNDENGNPISPGEFIPVAEKIGLIDKVDFCVLKKSIDFFGKLIEKTGTDAVLSVNISVRHLMKKDFLDEIRDVLAKSKVPPGQMEIEITESIMIDSVEKALQCINEIVDMGIKIAIDDFGTGYSSLSYLNKFPANLLKVDKSFVDKMNTSESSRQYVAAIISIGHIMNFKVIAEGVEKPEQLETLRSIGCDYVQGFIWGKPMPADEIEKLVQNIR